MDGLFPPDLPDGFRYVDAFLDPAEETALLARIRDGVTFSTFEMRGVVARRRVAFFGQAYDATRPAAPMPAFIEPLRARVASWAGIDAAALAMALINQYAPGAPIGWHRDAPQYGIVLGVSLLSACRMRLRPYVSPKDVRPGGPRRATSHEITLQPRSIYQIAGLARSGYEHSIPPAAAPRYSITFRTLRRPPAA
jgi:alkylated DNA repair protein (DNA oxidative demethylase)